MYPIQSRSPPPDLLYHHCIPVSAASQRIITPDHSYSDQDFLPAYNWVEQVTGFYPLFLAVGTSDILWMTGYQDNWRIWTGSEVEEGVYRETYRKKGEFPNLAVFSFGSLDGVYMDYDYWHNTLNTIPNGKPITTRETKWIFKPSWTKSRWIRAALKGTCRVQFVVPELNLMNAKAVFVRNLATKNMLEDLGYSNVTVKRIPVERW